MRNKQTAAEHRHGANGIRPAAPSFYTVPLDRRRLTSRPTGRTVHPTVHKAPAAKQNGRTATPWGIAASALLLLGLPDRFPFDCDQCGAEAGMFCVLMPRLYIKA
jgi:hypothetical protein